MTIPIQPDPPRAAITAADGGAAATVAASEWFTTPTLTIGPISIASAEAFGSPVLTTHATVHPTAIPSAEAFGTPRVADMTQVHPTGIASAEAFGSPTLTTHATIEPTGIPSGEAFGSPVVTEGSTQAVAPPGIPSAEAFGLPSVGAPVQYIDLAGVGITPEGEFGRTAVLLVGQVLWPVGIDSAESFGDPDVGAFPPQLVRVRSVVQTTVFGTPAITISAASPVGAVGADSTLVFGVPIILQRVVNDPPRNLLIDRVTREIYPWPLNHATEDAIKTLGRRLTRSGISASGKLLTTRKVFLVKQPTHPGPAHLILHGSMLDRTPPTQYQTFVRFFRESDDRTFDYVDASGDSYHIAIVQFDARRHRGVTHTDGSWFDYSLEVEIIDVHQGALKGYVV